VKACPTRSALVPMPPSTLVDVTEPVELAALVGMGPFTRGRAYAREGRVRLLHHDPGTGEVSGQCRGSGNHVYITTLEYEYSPVGVLTAVDGECSCPVGYNCKHVVALLLTALGSYSADGVGGEGTDRASGPSWRSVFGDLLPSASTTSARLALAFEFTPERTPGPRGAPGPRRTTLPWHIDHGDPGALNARPLRMGKRGRWIVTGAAWAKIAQGAVEDADPDQLDALQEVRRADPDWDPYYASSRAWIDFSAGMAPDMWRVLARVVAAGVELVESDSFAPVLLETSPARADVSIVSDEGGNLHLEATLLHPGLAPDSPRVMCGMPVHGLAWRDASGNLHLAGLERPASRTWQVLSRQRGEVVVPSAERGAFEREILPRLERSGWFSPDGSFAPAPPTPPTLQLDITPEATSGVVTRPGARLHWTWVRPGNEGEGVGIERRDRFAIDEGDAEVGLLTEVCHLLVGLEGTVEEDSSAAGGASVGAGASVGVPAGTVDASGGHARVSTRMRPCQDARLRGMEVVRLVDEVLPRLEALGVTVLRHDLPELRDAGAPLVRIEVGAEGPDWFDLDVHVEVGGAEVPMASLVRALTLGEDVLFLPDGTYAHLDDPALDHLRRLLAEAAELSDQRRSTLRVPQVRLSWWEELLSLGIVDTSEHAWFQAVRDAVAQPPEPALLPAGLRATLRPYQVEGFQWLSRLRRSGLGGVLADDMGLGKTLQVLAMILDEREGDGAALVGGEDGSEGTGECSAARDRGPWLVVAPTSVVPNWVAEAGRFAPDLRVVAIEATRARRGTDLADATRGADVVVTSYALLRLEEQDYADLGVVGLVLDEAHNAKNHNSRTFAAVKKVLAPVLFAITGTPMENHLGELWSMFALTAPGLLGTPAQFGQSYRRPLEHGDDADGQLMARLRRRVAPFLLRRTKEDVALDLPPKQEQVLDVELVPAHRHIYDRHLQRERQRILGLAEDLEHNQVEVLAALTRLRQLAIDPALVEEGSSAPSSKMEVLVPLLERAAQEGHRVLVFSQFTRYLRRIAQRLDRAGVSYSYLDGTTPRRRRVIEGFAQGEDPVFLISLKAGGVGLNLAMADYAVLADPWWNPAAEAQAVDRAHRIGQTRPVHVYRLIARDTIEEKVLALQQRKRDLAAGVLSGETTELAPTGTDGVGANGAPGATDPGPGTSAGSGSGGRSGRAAGRTRAAGGAALSAEDLQLLLG